MEFKKKWQQLAHSVYYDDHLSILTAAEIAGVSRQTASQYLKSLPEWKKEQVYRRDYAEKKKKESKRRWDFHNRIGINLKREHEQAVRELSAERYH